MSYEVFFESPAGQELTQAFEWYELRKFPYGLHYRVIDDKVSVLACLHFRRSPEHWPGA